MNEQPDRAERERDAAPAVDDDLLRAVGEQVRHSVYLGISDIGIARLLKVSDAGQRLRAAWAAEAVRSGDVVERAQYDHVLTEAKVVERERDEAYRQKTEWQATAGRLGVDALKGDVTVLQNEASIVNEVWRSGIDDDGQGWVWQQGSKAGYPFSYRSCTELALDADRMRGMDNAGRAHFLFRELPAELIATDTKEN